MEWNAHYSWFRERRDWERLSQLISRLCTVGKTERGVQESKPSAGASGMVHLTDLLGPQFSEFLPSHTLLWFPTTLHLTCLIHLALNPLFFWCLVVDKQGLIILSTKNQNENKSTENKSSLGRSKTFSWIMRTWKSLKQSQAYAAGKEGISIKKKLG